MSEFFRFLCIFHVQLRYTGPGSSVGCLSAWYLDSHRFDLLVGQHFFMEIGHEIISMAALSLPLIQVWQMSATCERMCTKDWLTV